jgi:hypothetical protein
MKLGLYKETDMQVISLYFLPDLLIELLWPRGGADVDTADKPGVLETRR